MEQNHRKGTASMNIAIVISDDNVSIIKDGRLISSTMIQYPIKYAQQILSKFEKNLDPDNEK